LWGESKTNQVGSLLVQDSVFENTNIAIFTKKPSPNKNPGVTGINLDNVAFTNVQNPIMDEGGTFALSKTTQAVSSYIIGNSYANPSKKEYTHGTHLDRPRVPGLTDSVSGREI
jgi:hypothetical protein